MKREDFYNAPKYAAVYMFRNKINNKCYIGQAVKLKKRLLHHLNNLENNRYDAPIYRAIAKYGLENFELVILRTWHDALSARTKYELDASEKAFIEQYNSYAPNGYNQTLGGDGGILGYKMTEELKKRISDNTKNTAINGRFIIYIYDIKEKSVFTFPNCVVASKKLNVSSNSLRNKRVKMTANRYISARSEEALQQKIQNFYYKENESSSLINYYNYIISLQENNKLPTITKLATILGVTRDTLNKRNRRLRDMGYSLPWDSIKC